MTQSRKMEIVEQDGKQLRRWEYAGAVRSWNLTTGEPQKTFQHVPPRYIAGMRLSPDGNQFITYGTLPGTYEFQGKGIVSIWDARTGKYFDLPDNTEYHGRFSPAGTIWVATAVDKDGYATSNSRSVSWRYPSLGHFTNGQTTRLGVVAIFSVALVTAARNWRF